MKDQFFMFEQDVTTVDGERFFVFLTHRVPMLTTSVTDFVNTEEDEQELHAKLQERFDELHEESGCRYMGIFIEFAEDADDEYTQLTLTVEYALIPNELNIAAQAWLDARHVGPADKIRRATTLMMLESEDEDGFTSYSDLPAIPGVVEYDDVYPEEKSDETLGVTVSVDVPMQVRVVLPDNVTVTEDLNVQSTRVGSHAHVLKFPKGTRIYIEPSTVYVQPYTERGNIPEHGPDAPEYEYNNLFDENAGPEADDIGRQIIRDYMATRGDKSGDVPGTVQLVEGAPMDAISIPKEVVEKMTKPLNMSMSSKVDPSIGMEQFKGHAKRVTSDNIYEYLSGEFYDKTNLHEFFPEMGEHYTPRPLSKDMVEVYDQHVTALKEYFRKASTKPYVLVVDNEQWELMSVLVTQFNDAGYKCRLARHTSTVTRLTKIVLHVSRPSDENGISRDDIPTDGSVSPSLQEILESLPAPGSNSYDVIYTIRLRDPDAQLIVDLIDFFEEETEYRAFPPSLEQGVHVFKVYTKWRYDQLNEAMVDVKRAAHRLHDYLEESGTVLLDDDDATPAEERERQRKEWAFKQAHQAQKQYRQMKDMPDSVHGWQVDSVVSKEELAELAEVPWGVLALAVGSSRPINSEHQAWVGHTVGVAQFLDRDPQIVLHQGGGIIHIPRILLHGPFLMHYLDLEDGDNIVNRLSDMYGSPIGLALWSPTWEDGKTKQPCIMFECSWVPSYNASSSLDSDLIVQENVQVQFERVLKMVTVDKAKA